MGGKSLCKRLFDNSLCPKVDPGLRSRTTRFNCLYPASPPWSRDLWLESGSARFVFCVPKHTWKTLSESSNFYFATIHFWPVQTPSKTEKTSRFWRYWLRRILTWPMASAAPHARCGHTHTFKKQPPLEWNDLLETVTWNCTKVVPITIQARVSF